MGVVWKARDSRLDRVVAIKISKEQFTKSFENEARVIAALNHPHVCQLYDVGPNYVVMEFVEGISLHGPIPLDKAIEYAAQILDALDAAHRKRITHRDLKPANILVTKKGIKLLDFGLAKRAAIPDDSEATLLAGQSKNGEIAGTLQYMSPEQLQGKQADARSDIFSFGCVLYEMLTGKRAFSGGSAASVIAAIMEREPQPLETTPGVQRILQRCLAKDPEDRWQTARDLKEELIWNGGLKEAPGKAGPSGIQSHWQWITAMVFGMALAVVATRAYLAPSGGEVLRLSVNPPPNSFFTRMNTTVPVPQFALSPDGDTIVFVAGEKSQLWVRSLAEVNPRLLAGTDNAEFPFWSPDSGWIGFFVDRKIKKIPVSGGAVQAIAEAVANYGATWGNDDTILFVARNGGISRVASTGGEVLSVTKVSKSHGIGSHRWPHFLPDGRHFLFMARGTKDHDGIYLGSLDGNPEKFLIRRDSGAIYSQPGYVLYTDGDTLFAHPFDLNTLELRETVIALDQGIGRSGTYQTAISASRTGRIAYAPAMWRQGRLTWHTRTGTSSGIVGTEGDWTDFRLSPDQKTLAAALVDRKNSSPDLWVTDLVRGSTSRVAFGYGLNASVSWSPDGASILFRTTSRGVADLHLMTASGTGSQPVLLHEQSVDRLGTSFRVPSDWSGDGKHVLMTIPEVGTGIDIWKFSIGGDREVKPFVVAASDQMHGNFSPDSRLVAYSSNESGRFEVVVRAFDSPGGRWQVSTEGGSEPRWRHDGREIYYLSPDHKLMAVSVGPGPSFGVPQPLFETQVAQSPSPFRTHYVPSSDGQRFLINDQSNAPPTDAITVILNLDAALKKKQ